MGFADFDLILFTFKLGLMLLINNLCAKLYSILLDDLQSFFEFKGEPVGHFLSKMLKSILHHS